MVCVHSGNEQRVGVVGKPHTICCELLRENDKWGSGHRAHQISKAAAAAAVVAGGGGGGRGSGLSESSSGQKVAKDQPVCHSQALPALRQGGVAARCSAACRRRRLAGRSHMVEICPLCGQPGMR